MKRFILLFALLLLTVVPLKSQHYIGARGGWGVGYGRFEPISSYNMKWVMGTWSGGVQWKYYGQMKYVGAVGAEVEFIQRAYQIQESLESENYYRRVINSVNLPIMWHVHVNMLNNKFRVFLNAGVWVSYNLSSRYWEKDGDYIFTGSYQPMLVRDNPLGYGLLGGVGFNVVFGKWELMMEGRYYFSYGDILRNSAVYKGNPVRSPLDNINISLGFFYRIGNKPHAPQPSAKYLSKQAAKAAEKRVQQLNENNDGNDETEQSSETDTEGHQ